MDFVVRAYVSQSKEGPSKEAMLQRSRSIKSTLNTYNNKAPTPRITKPNEPHNPYKPWTKPDEPNRFDPNSRRPDAHPQDDPNWPRDSYGRKVEVTYDQYGKPMPVGGWPNQPHGGYQNAPKLDSYGRPIQN